MEKPEAQYPEEKITQLIGMSGKNPQEMIRKKIVRLFIFQPIKTIPDDVLLEQVSFMNSVLAYKTGTQNFEDIMPIGGGVKKNEKLDAALRRESMEESATRPTRFKEIGFQPYIFYHKSKNRILLNLTTYYSGDNLASDRHYPLDPEEDKLEFVYLSKNELEVFLNNQEADFVLGDGTKVRGHITDSMNVKELQRLANQVWTFQEDVETIRREFHNEFVSKEMNFLRELCKAIIKTLPDERFDKGVNIGERKQKIEERLITVPSHPHLYAFYQRLVAEFQLSREEVQYALDLVNLQIEVDSLENSEKESWLRAPAVIQDWRNLTRDKLMILCQNAHLANIIDGFMRVGQLVQEELAKNRDQISAVKDGFEKRVEGSFYDSYKALYHLGELPDSGEFDEKLFPLFEDCFGIKKEHYFAAEEKANAFIAIVANSALQKQLEIVMGSSDKSRHPGLNPSDYRQINIVSEENYPKGLLEMALGLGPIMEYYSNDPETFKLIQFESQRKIALMRIASEAMDWRDKVSKLHRSTIEKRIFLKLCPDRQMREFFLIERRLPAEKQGIIIDVALSKAEAEAICIQKNNEFSQFVFFYRAKPFKCRKMKIKGQEVDAYVHSRSQKSVMGFMRKMMIRNCRADEIHDPNGRAIVFIDPSKVIEKHIKIYERANENALIERETSEKDKDFESVYDLFEEMHDLGTDEDGIPRLKIINYRPTPGPGEAIVSAGPGGGAELKFAKAYIQYTDKNGEETEEEIMIFNKTEEKSGLGNYLTKSEDDEQRYPVARFFHTQGSKSLFEKLFPGYAYGQKIKEVFKKPKTLDDTPASFTSVLADQFRAFLSRFLKLKLWRGR